MASYATYYDSELGMDAPAPSSRNSSKMVVSVAIGAALLLAAAVTASPATTSLFTTTQARTLPSHVAQSKTLSQGATMGTNGYIQQPRFATAPRAIAQPSALSSFTYSVPQSQPQSSLAPLSGPVALCGALALSGLLYALHRLRPTQPAAAVEPRWAMAATSGKRFDPLGLEEQPTGPKADLELYQGKLVLCSWVAAATMFSAGPANANLYDLGFNYDFDVEFAGVMVDHRILVNFIVFGQTLGFLGALVTGNLARTRKQETEDLAQKLLTVNKQLRQQARGQKEGSYKPDVLGDAECPETDDECDITRTMVIQLLKKGKSLLREGDGATALTNFQSAINMIRDTPEFEEPLLAKRKSYRGIGAAQILNGNYQEALEAMQMVLDLTRQIGDSIGLTDAYGVIADIYTDLNNLTKAGEYYDLYLAQMDKDTGSEETTL